MKYLSLFSGIGGFELGIQKALEGRKCRCVGFSEIDPYAIRIYESHFSNHKNFGDIRKINPGKLPAFDLLVGGFPCQAFSIAGKRLGFADQRGTLFFDIARILKSKRPEYFLLENVKGLLSHDSGRTFKFIIATLTELGYCVTWAVLNSTNFGVPQNRERVFIVGRLGDKPAREVFLFQTSDQSLCAKDREKKRSGLKLLADGDHHSKRIYDVTGSSPSICSSRSDVPVIAISCSSSREFRWSTKRSPALCAVDYKNPKLVRIGRCLRKLTPTEFERLQGFPDGWTACVSDTQRYKCLGNAVTVNVVEAIITNLFNIKYDGKNGKV